MNNNDEVQTNDPTYMCVRFRVYGLDHRPEVWPIKHPYWLEKVGDSSEGEYCIIRAYAHTADEIFEMWPHAEEVEVLESQLEKYKYTGKFPKPIWFYDENMPEGSDTYDILVVEFDVIEEKVLAADLFSDATQIQSRFRQGLDPIMRLDFTDQPDYVPLHLPARPGKGRAYLAIKGRFLEQILDVYPADAPFFDADSEVEMERDNTAPVY